MSQLKKVYDCLNCGVEIRIEKIDNPPAGSTKKWNKFNLDGSEHTCCSNTFPTTKKKQQQQQQEITTEEPKALVASRQILDLTDEIANLKGYIKNLVSQVQMLRQEVSELKK